MLDVRGDGDEDEPALQLGLKDHVESEQHISSQCKGKCMQNHRNESILAKKFLLNDKELKEEQLAINCASGFWLN